MKLSYWVSALAAPLALAGVAANAGTPATVAPSANALLTAPVYFEENVGQAPAQSRFVSQGVAHHFSIGSTYASFAFGGSTVTLRLLGATNPQLMAGRDKQPGISNYYQGSDPSRWRTGIAQYGRVRANSIYPGVDLEYYANHGRLEYDFLVSPGADTRPIRFRFEGAQSVTLDPKGNLLLKTSTGTLTQFKPVVYQERAGARLPVAGSYRVDRDGVVSLSLGQYDRTLPLVVDPVLDYSTYVQLAAPATRGRVAPNGDLVFAGVVRSTSDVAGTAGTSTVRGGNDVFVMRTNSTGTTVLVTTIFGGRGDDAPSAIAIGALGQVLVGGNTVSLDFPLLGPAQLILGGSFDAFVTHISSAGTLTYSTYLGGTDFESVGGVALDGSGNAYVVGTTNSFDFPLAVPYQASYGGAGDAFFAKFSSGGNRLLSSFLGGAGADNGYAIGVDSTSSIYVAGQTSSANFPTQAALQGALSGVADGFITKLQPSGTLLTYSTYYGGTGSDKISAIVVDSANAVLFTGDSNSATIPLANPAFAANSGGRDGFVGKLRAAGNQLDFATFLGGGAPDTPTVLANDASGNVYVGGQTYSSNFPVNGSLQAAKVGLGNAFLSSSDGGVTFTPVVNATEASYQQLLVAPVGPPVAYLFDTCSVTLIQGSTWTGPISMPCNANVRVHHPTVAGTIFAGTYGALYRSTDFGVTWIAVTGGLPASPFVNSVVFDPGNASIVYAGLDGNQGVYKSLDGGNTWSALAGPPDRYIGNLVFTSTSLVAVTATGVYRSTTGGASWTGPATGLPANITTFQQAVAAPSAAPGRVYLATNCKLYVSSDHGVSFVTREPGACISERYGMAVSPTAPNTVYLTGASVHKTIDAGVNWTSVGDLSKENVRGLSVSSDGATVYAMLALTGDLFLTRLSSAGAVGYSTLLGGRFTDSLNSIQVDASRVATLIGVATDGFPVTSDAINRTRTFGAFVSRISEGSAACAISAYASRAVYPAAGSTIRVQVVAPAGCAWTATTGDPWITLDGSTTNSNGAGFVLANLGTNAGASRSGSITVGGTPVAIAQTGNDCNFAFSPPNTTVGKDGASGTISMTTTGGCQWYLDNQFPWLTITSAQSGTGSTTISYVVAPHPGTTQRSATLIVNGAFNSRIDQQASPAVQPVLTPTFAFRGTDGGLRFGSLGTTVLQNTGGLFSGEMSASQDRVYGHTWIAARDPGGSLWLNRWVPVANRMAGFANRGGVMVGAPAVAAGPFGTAWFAIRDEFKAYWITSHSAVSGAGPWIPLGGVLETDPAITVSNTGIMYIVGRDVFKGVWVGRYDTNTNQFLEWSFIGGVIQGKPSVTTGLDNALYISIRDDFNGLWMGRFAGPGQILWFLGGGVCSTDPLITSNGSGLIYATLLGPNSDPWRRPFTEGSSAANWGPWTAIGGVFTQISVAGTGGDFYLLGQASFGTLYWWRLNTGQFTVAAQANNVGSTLNASPR